MIFGLFSTDEQPKIAFETIRNRIRIFFIDTLNLSNYQNSASKANFQQIQDNCGPAFIDAGSNAGGFSHYCYYKNKNEEMYLFEFYLQECVSFYKIKDVSSLNGPMFGEYFYNN